TRSATSSCVALVPSLLLSRMEEEDARIDEKLLALHLGALYSCPTELPLGGVPRNNDGSISGEISARCLVPDETCTATAALQASRSSDTQRHGRNDYDARAGGSACTAAFAASASGPIREVFCRAVPLQLPQSQVPPPSDSSMAKTEGATAEPSDDGAIDGLREALGLMYREVHAVRSPSRPSAAVAGPGLAQDGLVVDDDAAQPLDRGEANLATPVMLSTCTRLHAGLVPLYTPLVESGGGAFLMFTCLPFRLTALTHLCRAVRGVTGIAGRRNRHSVDLIVRFVFYQLLRAVDFLHSRGITVGNLSSGNILLTEHAWVQIAPSIPRLLDRRRRQKRQPRQQDLIRRPTAIGSPRPPPGEDLPLTYRWVKGMVSNLEYLLAVNAAAGRLVGDRSCHPIVPWVCDFTGRVDLTMTKFRLKKGDEQLDRSYSGGNPPHHIPESLSELTLVVYLARKLPLQVLREVVRSELIAEEYPKSLARMYSWTPDECVPEFYTDPGVFRSTHGDAGGLPDLEAPSWCNGSPEEFIRYHRSLLEGERVSRGLHRWLDLTFGYCLRGQAALDNKNVPLPPPGAAGTTDDFAAGRSFGGGFTLSGKRRPGFVQLFRHPHPPRNVNASTSTADTVALASTPATDSTSSRPSRGRRDVTPASKAGTATIVSPSGVRRAAAAEKEEEEEEEEEAGVEEQHAPEAQQDSIEGRPCKSPGAGGADGAGSGAEDAPPTAVVAVVGEGADKETKGGGASIFGVAFDDYIGEEGVRHHVSATVTATAAAGGGSGRGGTGGDGADGGDGGEARASVEEDRRALAFARDVDLRLEPWYGRPRARAARPSGSSGSSDGNDGRGGRQGQDNRTEEEGGEPLPAAKADDLFACGCVLAEMCAGEPIVAAPSEASPGGEGRSRGGGLELPPALRNTIRALTRADPEKRPSAHALLSSAEPALHHRGVPSSSVPSSSSRAARAGRRPEPATPGYRRLFPPYMRDVYAFLAAVHQEETPHKRLVLAAAALPVLQVPLHAFSLAMPHLIALLGALPPTAKEGRRAGGPRRPRSSGTGGGGAPPALLARGRTRAVAGGGDGLPAAGGIGASSRSGRREERAGVSRKGEDASTAAGVTKAATATMVAAEPLMSPMVETVEETAKGHLEKSNVSEEPSAAGEAGAESIHASDSRSAPLAGEVPEMVAKAAADVAEPELAAEAEGEREGREQDLQRGRGEKGEQNEGGQERQEGEEEEEEEDDDENDGDREEQDKEETMSRAAEAEAAKHAEAWVSVLDASAARLGPGLAAEALLPTVLPALERVRSPEHACRLMNSDVWGVLARRIATETFLRRVFPLLLAWLEQGVGVHDDGEKETSCCCDGLKTVSTRASGGEAEDQAGEEGIEEEQGAQKQEQEQDGQEQQEEQGQREDGHEPEEEQGPEEKQTADRAPQTRDKGRGGGEEGAAARPTVVSPRNNASGKVIPTANNERSSSPQCLGRNGGSARQGGVGVGGRPGERTAKAGGGGSAASRVQVAAAASVSHGIFDCLGPALAARYLIPALVDCLGRLATTAAAAAAASSAHRAAHAWGPSTPASKNATPAPTPPPPDASEPLDVGSGGALDDGAASAASVSAPPSPSRSTRGPPEIPFWQDDDRDCFRHRGDPASLALLRYCRTRGAMEEFPDAGVGGGTSLLVLSRALGDVCLQVRSEEVTVPLVLSRVFHQILPCLAPVLAQRGGASATATGFRSVLEVTSLLGRLLPTLCPETISHFYVGRRPAVPSPPLPVAAAASSSSSSLPKSFPESYPTDATGSAAAVAVLSQATASTFSVPWLLLAMPLPIPVAGLDVPRSTEDETGDGTPSASPERKTSIPSDRSPGRSGEPPEDRSRSSTAVDGGGTALGDGRESHRAEAAGGTGADAAAAAATATATATAAGARIAANGNGLATRFVCHVEAARLLATTAMGILGDDDGGDGVDEEGEEECARVLQAAEAFFAAFERSYCGFDFSSPTMMIALKLARELHTPLASLFGFDVMRQFVPSASSRIVPWLTGGAVPAREDSLQPSTAVPREGFGGLRADRGSFTATEDRRGGDNARHEHGDDAVRPGSSYRSLLGSGGDHAGAAIAGGGRGLKSSWKARRGSRTPPSAAGGGYAEKNGSDLPWRGRSRDSARRGGGGGDGAPPRLERASSEADGAMYISPAGSPERGVFQGSGHGLFGGGGGAAFRRGSREEPGRSGRTSTAQAPLLNRIQQAIQQRLDGTAAAASAATSALRTRQPKHLSTTRGIGRGTRSAAGSGSVAPDSRDGGGGASTVSEGGQLPYARARDSDALDPLLPPPSSSLPPSVSSRGRRRGGGGGARAQGQGGGNQSQQHWAGGEAQERVDRLSWSSSVGNGGNEDGVFDEQALEWPSLLGALGSRAPSPPPLLLPGGSDPPYSQAATTAAAATAAAASAAAACTGLVSDQQEELPRVRRDIAEAAA
ncbi:unnamed protein product, partial [Scytosiphon promiscuus]